MIYDKARELASLLKNSDEYKAYLGLKETATANETTKALIKEYHQLQFRAQSAAMSGKKDDETLERLQKVGEILQLNREASEFLLAEYRLNIMLSDVYKILAEAIDVDLGMLED
ncbi:MAG: YlbF family regulator [Clostridiaceae bacterium]|nr:YlbF family regulator [Eubacteriales bacterium]